MLNVLITFIQQNIYSCVVGPSYAWVVGLQNVLEITLFKKIIQAELGDYGKVKEDRRSFFHENKVAFAGTMTIKLIFVSIDSGTRKSI